MLADDGAGMLADDGAGMLADDVGDWRFTCCTCRPVLLRQTRATGSGMVDLRGGGRCMPRVLGLRRQIQSFASSDLSGYKKDRIDYARWSMVDEILEQRALLQQELRQLSCLKGHKARQHLEERQALLQWLGTNLETAFECASEQLTGTDAAGSDSTIKRSYSWWSSDCEILPRR